MKNFTLQNMALARELFGHHNHNLDKISEAFEVTINNRGNSLLFKGDDKNIHLAEKLILELYQLLEKNVTFGEADIDAAINTVKNNNHSQLKDLFETKIFKTVRNKAITPRNPSQQKYASAIRENDLLFAIGSCPLNPAPVRASFPVLKINPTGGGHR